MTKTETREDREKVMPRHTADVFRKVMRSVANADQLQISDRELLRRFTRDRDQAAFSTLVGRHSGMVFGVCRRTLSHLQDAEDACQATFLLLAQKAGSVRWQPSIANWLYTAARKVAHNARVVAERRARRERHAAVPESVPPIDDMTARELLSILDEELTRLPAQYRAPLVLCCLEGLTRDEAATRLGIPASTLKIRLERARKRLGESLTRRGVALGAGLLALAATSPAEASPPRLVEAILTTVLGSAPAAVVELTRRMAVNEGFKKSVLALVVLMIVFALGIGGSVVMPGAAGQGPNPPQKPARPEAKKPPAWTVSGRVLAPDGIPLPGAKLFFMRQGAPPADGGASGPDGHFQIYVPAGYEAVVLVARADGVGVGFLEAKWAEREREVEVKTVKDHPIRGWVVDEEGRPVKKVEVTVTGVHVYAGDSLDSFLAELKKQPPWRQPPSGVRYLLAYAGPIFETKTDADGRFTVSGVGTERFVTLLVGGEGRARYVVNVVNRAGFDLKPLNQELDEKIQKLENHWYEYPLSGPDLTLTTEAEKPIRGVVKNANGRSLAGVTVHVTAPGYDQPRPWPPEATATTDAKGRYEIRAARKSRAYGINVPADPVAGFLEYDTFVNDTPGHEPITADVLLLKGVVITGKVIDGATKKAVPGFARVFVPPDNPFIELYPGLEKRGISYGNTGADGTFRIVTIPGPVIFTGSPYFHPIPGSYLDALRYKISVPDQMYPQYFKPSRVAPGAMELTGRLGNYPLSDCFCKVLEIKPDAGVVRQDIIAEPCPVLKINVRDAEGRPLPGAFAGGVRLQGSLPSRFEKDIGFTQLEPGKPRLVVLWESTRKLIGTYTLRGDEKDELVVKLGESGSVKGRLLDEDGMPLARVVVKVRFQEQNAQGMEWFLRQTEQPKTADDGTFRVDAIIPGQKLTFAFTLDRQAISLAKEPGDLVVKPKEVLDVGSIQRKP